MARYKSALAELADTNDLEFTWREFYRETPKSKRKSSGVDGISFLTFQAKKQEILKEISDELLGKKVGSSRKQYHHSPLGVFPVEKPDKDQYRIICIPTIKDRLIQKSLLRLLVNRGYKFETKISYGYSREKSVKKALVHAKQFRNKKPWVYKTDIKSFFDVIPRDEIKECVAKKIRFRSLFPIIHEAIDAEITISIDKEVKDIIIDAGIIAGKGLRQGLPLSPLLSNLYLEEFDKCISASNISAIRYADDLAIFCSSRENCLKAHEFCVKELSKLGLEVQPIGSTSKTIIYEPDDIAEFLGLGLVKTDDRYELRITDSQIDKVWKKFEKFKDIESNDKMNIKLAGLYHRMESMVDSYKGHYGEADNYPDFEANLKKWRKKVYRAIFRDQYNVDIDKLSKVQQRFLHLLD